MRFSLSLPVLALLAPGAAGQQLPDAPKETFVEVPGIQEFTGEMIARPIQVQDAEKYGVTESEARTRHDEALTLLSGFPVVETWPEVDWVVISVEEGTENQVARDLMATGTFEYVEPNWMLFPVGCPNDSKFGSQWHHNANRMNSCAGWDLETGDPSVVVAICDTGVRTTHQDLQANRVEGYNAVTHLWENQGGQINDINGHGTATTGCAAANGNNGIGITGTGWNLSHRMMRVTNDAGGGATLNALTHAARTSADVGDKVQSVSYSGVQSSGVDTTGAYCRGKGAILVWAAGNSSQKLFGNRNDNVVVVGATNASDGKASFSNYGPFVDFMAPGENIYTTQNSCNTCYGGISGTSFSCPLTAGLAGLLYSRNPSATPTEIENALRNGCDDLGTSGPDDTFGYGRIDVFNSLNLIGGGCSTSTYCNPGDGSTNNVALISASSCNLANNVVITMVGAPANQFAYLLVGDGNTKVTQPPGSIGDLCVTGGGCLGRYAKDIGQIDALGIFSLDISNTLSGGANYGLPICGGNIQSGDTFNFQFWHRNPMGAPSTFSEAISISFQ